MTKKKVWKMPTEVYSRVVGYLRPITSWNAGKKQELRERVNYLVPKDPTEPKGVQNVRTL